VSLLAAGLLIELRNFAQDLRGDATDCFRTGAVFAGSAGAEL
jgi:hypothetical protein